MWSNLFLLACGEIDNRNAATAPVPLCPVVPEDRGKTRECHKCCYDRHPCTYAASFRKVPDSEEKEEWHNYHGSYPLLRAHRGRHLPLSEDRREDDDRVYRKEHEPETWGSPRRTDVL